MKFYLLYPINPPCNINFQALLVLKIQDLYGLKIKLETLLSTTGTNMLELLG